MSYRQFVLVLLIIALLSTPLRAYGDGQPVINEFLPHPSTGNKEWVELYIPEGTDITNYWIDDDTDFVSDSGSSAKKQITSVVQGSDSRHVVFELSSSMFNNDGDTVALFSSDGNLVDQGSYTGDPGTDISIGRAPDATGDFQVLAFATRGSPNSLPQPTITPTPFPTDKPTPTSKPSATPKPIKSPTATTIPTGTKNFLSNATTVVSHVEKSFVPTVKVGSNGAQPTSILGASTKSAEKKITPLPTKPILVKGTSSSLSKIIVMSVGVVLLLGCGILLYWKRIRKQKA